MLVLVVDDEEGFSRGVCNYLERQGFETVWASSGEQGLTLARERTPAVALVDIRLPGLDGLDLCRRLRSLGDMIIIVLSAFEAGPMVQATQDAADLWLHKPLRMDEFVSRLRALLRLSERLELRDGVYNDGRLYLDPVRQLAKREGTRIELSQKEWDLLGCLLQQRNQVVSREYLVERVWGSDQEYGGQYLAQYVSRLRHKLDPGQPKRRYIRTVRGQGYWFCSQDATEPLVNSSA